MESRPYQNCGSMPTSPPDPSLCPALLTPATRRTIRTIVILTRIHKLIQSKFQRLWYRSKYVYYYGNGHNFHVSRFLLVPKRRLGIHPILGFFSSSFLFMGLWYSQINQMTDAFEFVIISPRVGDTVCLLVNVREYLVYNFISKNCYWLLPVPHTVKRRVSACSHLISVQVIKWY